MVTLLQADIDHIVESMFESRQYQLQSIIDQNVLNLSSVSMIVVVKNVTKYLYDYLNTSWLDLFQPQLL